uniref:Uncharacterized protein n=1 Tax=Lactuca sativa TaxID=4236 RepID=A0A9R1UP27_LACSA|nr:hypothetical protein LSAT_V11C800419100 [Lactuca sativa]
MDKAIRKHGRKPKNAVDTKANPNSNIAIAEEVVASLSVVATSTTSDHRGSQRRRKIGKEKVDDIAIVASPERRASRHTGHKGDCDIVGTVADGPLRWESVGKVVPSMDVVVKVFCIQTKLNLSLPWQ